MFVQKSPFTLQSMGLISSNEKTKISLNTGKIEPSHRRWFFCQKNNSK